MCERLFSDRKGKNSPFRNEEPPISPLLFQPLLLFIYTKFSTPPPPTIPASPYYMEPESKYKENVKLMYMDTDSFVVEIETDDFYEDIKNDLEEWFDTSGYDKNMELPT